MVSVFDILFSILGLVIIILVVFYYLKRRKSFKIKTVICENRANGEAWRLDYTRRIRDKDGEYYLQFKSNKKKIKPIDFDFLHVGNFLVLYTPDGIAYFPAKMIRDNKFKVMISAPTSDDPKATKEVELSYFRATPDDIRFWQELEIKKALSRTDLTKTLERLAPLIGVGILLLLAGISLYIVQQGMANTAKEMGGISGGLAHVTDKLVEVIDRLDICGISPTQGVPVIPTPPF